MIYIHIYIYVHIHTFIYVYTYIYIRIYIDTYIYTHGLACEKKGAYLRVIYVHTYEYMYLYIFIFIYGLAREKNCVYILVNANACECIMSWHKCAFHATKRLWICVWKEECIHSIFFFLDTTDIPFFFPRIIPSRVTSCYMQAKKESLLCCVLVCVYVLGVRVCVGVYILQCARIERDNAVCT